MGTFAPYLRFTFVAALLFTGGCVGLRTQNPDLPHHANLFLTSGSIILSHQVPKSSASANLIASTERHSVSESDSSQRNLMAPLIGYFPPTNGFVPAENEVWVEINRASQKLSLYNGKKLVREIQGEGDVPVSPGDYFLQHKQKNPVWYAPDSYFSSRMLNIPPAGDRLRYRRGALGEFALYPTTSFPIHCAALWSQEVGGLRISAAELAALYLELPVGAPVVVK